MDLCHHLCSKHGISGSQRRAPALSGKTVLELGCGHGLPGILLMQSGAKAVHFQVRAAPRTCSRYVAAAPARHAAQRSVGAPGTSQAAAASCLP